MSRIRADKFVNNAADGAPQLTFGAEIVAGVGLTGAGGINITGVATAASFSGNLTGNVTGNADTATTATTATNAQGLTGSPNISVGTITATGNVSIGGTLTYEDVTNVDSVGIITARSGLKVSSGGASFVGPLTERAVVSATALSADDFCNVDSGLFHYRTANLGGTANNLRLNSTVGFNTIMATGDVMNFTLAHNVNATTAYVNNVFIEGVAQTENWVGGSAPSDGGGSGVDIYSFTIIKTASNTYTVIGNQTKTS